MFGYKSSHHWLDKFPRIHTSKMPQSEIGSIKKTEAEIIETRAMIMAGGQLG